MLIFENADSFMEFLFKNMEHKEIQVTAGDIERDICSLSSYDFYMKYVHDVKQIIISHESEMNLK